MSKQHTHTIELTLSDLAEADIEGLNDALDTSLAAEGSTHEAVDISYRIIGCVPGHDTSEGSVIIEATYTNNAPEDEDEDDDTAVWDELEFRPEGYFYIERTKASSSEYWPYRVEVNESHEGGYAVIDHTTDTLIGIIVPSPNTPAFKASVNGYEADQPFTNLKGAVVHIATEYNGI